MNNRGKAMAFGLTTVLIWSTVASAFKLSLRHLTPVQLLLLACGASIVALFGVLLFQRRIHTLRMPRRELVRAALLGVLNPFLYYLILFKAYDLLPAQEAQPLNYTWAVTLSLLSIPLLGQKMSLRQLMAILISYLGVVVISTHGNLLSMSFSDPLGVGLALFSTVIWALYWIFNTNGTSDPVAGLLVNFLAGFPLVLITCLLTDGLPALGTAALLGSGYVGFFEMGITFALWLAALKHASMPDGGGNARVANLIFLSPFLSLVLIHFIVGEEILVSTIAGLGLIIAGNAIMQTGRN